MIDRSPLSGRASRTPAKRRVDLLVVNAGSEREIDAGFASFVQQRVNAIVIGADSLFLSRRDHRRLRWAHSQKGEATRSAGAADCEIRAGRQSQDGEGARPPPAGQTPRGRARGERMTRG